MNFRVLLSLIKKEFIQIKRDPRTLGLIIYLPIFMLIIYGYGITYDVRKVPLAIYDAENSPESRDILRDFINSGYFSLKYVATSEEDAERAIDRNRASVVLIMKPGLMKKVKSSEEEKIQILLDGSDSNTATIALGYAQAILRKRSSDIIAERLDRMGIRVPFDMPLVEGRMRIWYNEELKSSHFIVPGIIAIIMMFMGALLTAFTVVNEKERGTIDQIIVSPVKANEFLLGKLFPYTLIAFMDMALIIVIGYLLFRVPISGSLILLMFGAFLYLICILNTGILVSTITDTPEGAMMLAVMLSLLPTILLSGFVFPIENMPAWIQIVTYAVPARYFLVIIRGIFLKGIGISVLWPSFLALTILGGILFHVSILRFRRQIT